MREEYNRKKQYIVIVIRRQKEKHRGWLESNPNVFLEIDTVLLTSISAVANKICKETPTTVSKLEGRTIFNFKSEL